MWIGLDFGTTNSGAAVYDGRRVHHFALDPYSHDPKVMRSTLYLTREQQVYVGQEAIDTYYRQNIGHPSRMIRRYVGEIEITSGDVGTVKGYPIGPQTEIRDVYVLVDELTPGRLLHSLKSVLATRYEGTAVFGSYYALEDLIALYLRDVRERVEAEADEAVEGVVLGRPVHFAGAADDQRAERRLRHAAEMAGFHNVAFELEPVAAALHYALSIDEPQSVAVFDLGGGTLDITVMRVGEPGGRHVYATGGIGIAGELFDQRILEGVMLDHFGRGSTWGQDGAPFPNHYTDALLHWQALPELSRPETLRFLRQAQRTSSHPRQLRALESLLVNNYAVRLIDEVEHAKVALSSDPFAAIRLDGEDIDIWQPLTRSQFEALIASEIRQIEDCLHDTVARSGLHVKDIDRVVRTGGSAQIPCLIEMIERTFPGRVVLSDVFSGVTAGLAIRAAMEA
jgi:hypothetical chaperone protein